MMFDASVVIPTYERPDVLRRCLDALAMQRVNGVTFDVVVVDDGSARGAAEAVADLRLPYRLTVLRQANAGPGAARNRGAQAADGRYCIFLDDDVMPERDLVAAHVAAQERLGGVVGVGRIATSVPERADWFTRASAASLDRGYAKLDAGAPLRWLECYSGNLSVPRDAFLAHGGFLTDLPRCEDIELGFRLERSGMRLQYVADARARQHSTKRLLDLARDLERAGEAAVALARRDARMGDTLLGGFARGAGPRQRRLLRTALALGLPIAAADLLARVVWRAPESRRRERFFHQLCFWRGVHRALRADRSAWRRLTAQGAAQRDTHDAAHDITPEIAHEVAQDAVT